MSDSDLDKILDELKTDDSVASLADNEPEERLDINDENINEYIMQNVGKLVQSGLEMVQSIQQTINSGFEADELNAFSGLLGAVTKAADTLNKINIQNKRAKTAKELKQLDLGKQRELGNGSVTNNVLIATREEIMEQFLKNNKKSIEAEIIEQNKENGEDEDE